MKAPRGMNAFALLESDEEEDQKVGVETPSTMSPRSELPCQDQASEEEQEASSSDWAPAQKRKARPVKTAEEKEAAAAKAKAAAEAAAAAAALEDFDQDVDAAFYLRKGTRHCHSKTQKMEWSTKSQTRLKSSKAKRQAQREASKPCACVVEEDDF